MARGIAGRTIRAVRMLRDTAHSFLDPVGYARSVGVRVGQNVRIYGMASRMFGSEPWMITLGNNVYLTAGVMFVTHDGGTLILRGEVPDLEWTAPIVVGNDVYVGVRSIILPGVTIGNRCIIGAGSIVAKSIPDNSVAAGVPARVIRTTDEYLDRLKAKSLKCGHLPANEKAEAIKKIYGITHV